MKNKFRSSPTYLATLFVVTVMASQASYACDTSAQNTLEREKAQLSELDLVLNQTNEQEKLYNFRSKDCVSLSAVHDELEVSDFLPVDETTLGMYQIFRDKGESQLDALKHTLEFSINRQQS